MDAHAEGEVPGRSARDVESIRMLPAPWIPIGGSEKEKRLLPFTELHTSDLDGPRCRSKKCLYGRFVPEHFLECGARQRRILSQPFPLIRMVREAEHRIAEPDD